MKMTNILLLLNLLLSLSAIAQIVQITNPSFEKGAPQSPDGWTLSGASPTSTLKFIFGLKQGVRFI